MANLANFMTTATLVLFAKQRLGLGDFGYGVLVGTMAVGGIVGSLLSPAIVSRFGGRAVTTTAVFFTPFTLLGVGFLARDMATMVALSALSSLGSSLWNVASGSLRQRTVPSGLLGRVSSAGLMLAWGAQPIGALLGGLIAASPLGLAGPWIVAGFLRLASGVLALPALSTWPRNANATATVAEPARV
jgi:MFS-type transporter involved in bile tolerance (Atg22 family)